MKPRLLPTWLGLLVVLASPAGLAAQSQGPKPARYTITDLGTLGGPYSFSYSLNDGGVVSGGSATTAQNGDPSQAEVNAPQTAFLWDHGQLRKLGTLGGPDSVAAAAKGFKLAVIDSETADL